jgi:hypothetical protein
MAVGIYQFEPAPSSVATPSGIIPSAKFACLVAELITILVAGCPPRVSQHFRKKLQMCNLGELSAVLSKGVRLAGLTPALC